VATGAVLTLSVGATSSEPGAVAAMSVLLAYSAWRTVRPFPKPGDLRVGTGALLVDGAIAVGAVAVSGGWNSPFVFALLVAIAIAGFTRDYIAGLAVAGFGALGLVVASVVASSARAGPETALQVLLVYTATAGVAGYTRKLFLETEARHAAFADRADRLTEANALLSQLTQVALTLPSSLDLGDTLATAMGHFRELFEFSGATILVLDAATDTWRAEASTGLPAPPPLLPLELPRALREVVGTSDGPRSVVEIDLDPAAGRAGLWPDSRSGVYASLLARRRLVALVAIEHREPGRFGSREAEVLSSLVEPLALAIDNGMWFGRLRVLGAESERERLARSLHDRIGQGLAYVGLELDRLSRLAEPGPDLVRLRQEVSALLGEVRETLHQLRARVTEDVGLAGLAAAHLPRLGARTGMTARFSGDPAGPRLPIPVEQELWRILQEALSNVERHSTASSVDVTWTCDGRRGRLEIRDDGVGFEVKKASDALTSGMIAMRERANTIGARLLVESQPGEGTRVAVEMEVHSP
jgi:signal transduction histidine kinase